jgi:hypothetical protein
MWRDSGRSVPIDDLAGDLLNAERDFLVACGSAPDRSTCVASMRVTTEELATMNHLRSLLFL